MQQKAQRQQISFKKKELNKIVQAKRNNIVIGEILPSLEV
jgi:hypothetical protein